MKKPLSLVLAFVLSGVSSLVLAEGAPSASAQLAASRQLAQLSEDYWDTQMRLSPLSATFVNYPKYHDRLEDVSAAGRAESHRQEARLLAALTVIDRSALGESGKVTYDVMKLNLERSLEGEKFKFWQFNVDHIDGYQSWIPTVITTAQPLKTSDDAEALLLRLKAFPSFFAAHVANLREGMKEGRVAARVPVERCIKQLEELASQKPAESPFNEAVKKLPADLEKLYGPKLLQAVETHVQPAYALYLRFLKDEYLPVTRVDKIGLSELPQGKEAYAFEIRYHTTVDKTPDQLHQMGLDELKQIREELAKIAKRRKFKGDVKAFAESIKKDPANFYKTREEIVRDAQQLIARAQAKVPQYFGTVPKTPLVVKPFEDYKEKNMPAAEYFEPADDLSRPGIYYINTYQPETRPRYAMTSLAAHEGIPGHHFQIALAMEKRDLPTFRRHGEFNAFVEGWALYTERLAEEMGLYQDDLSRVGMLSDQALRAARLVVDTGIHSFGWSRQKAIDFMKDSTVDSEEEIVNEVDRYIIWPGQALSYKVGQREILALRAESQKALGKKFDLRRFHDDVLKNGAIPLSILRTVVLGAPVTAQPGR